MTSYYVVIFLGLGLVTLSLLVVRFRHKNKIKNSDNSDSGFLQIIPTKQSDLSAIRVRELLKKLHRLIKPNSLVVRLFNQSKNISLFIDADARSGINLIVAVPKAEAQSARDLILSIDPSLEVSLIDYDQQEPVEGSENIDINNYQLARHYAYPLKIVTSKTEIDPLINLVSVISKLVDQEHLVLSFSMSSYASRGVKRLRDKLLFGQTPKLYNNRLYGLISAIIWLLVRLIVQIIAIALAVIQEITKPSSMQTKHSQAAADSQPLINVDNPLTISQLDKLYEPLFKVSFKAVIASPDKARRQLIAQNLGLSLDGYGMAGYQRLRPARHRSKLIARRDVYSASEIASFYHLPKMDNLESLYKLSSFKALPLSGQFKDWSNTGEDGLTIGQNSYQGYSAKINLPSPVRQRHVYISGATGSGKSAMLANLISQDIKKGRGVSLIDPHGDLSRAILQNIPKSRRADVIYFNPSDLDFPIGLNLLELKSFRGSPSYKLETDQITESVISLFRKLFSEDDSGGHRVEYIIRNSVQTALTIRGSTIFTIFKILTDNDFRSKVVDNLNNQDLKNFWTLELGRAGDYQRVKMSAGITAKIGRLLFSEPVRRVFGQSSSTINFEDILNENKILICNFSKGQLGEDGSRLFGTAILTKLQLAAFARSSQAAKNRKAHYLYVDEFQNFATESFSQMLSEARKYRLFLTIAEQSPSQQDSKLTAVILANIGNIVCFRNSSPADEQLLLPLFKPYLEAGDLLNIPAYRFYIKSLVSGTPAPISGLSLKPQESSDNQVFHQVISQSRQKYALNLNDLSTVNPSGQLKLL